MSAVGFDFGNESCVVAVARRTRIDVVLNDESKRQTPAIVCFGDKQRFIGTAGAATTMMNPKNSISQIKRLIGRQFSDPELQKDLKSLPFAVTEGPDGYPLIHAQYLGKVKTFTPTQILGMLFSDLKVIAEKNLNMDVSDCCIGIPAYFTDLQRRAVLDAATIAGLRPLRLIHETTAIALEYGVYKTGLTESEQVNVAFVDIGHTSMQVCIAGFKKGQLKILSYASERSLGGRDFDEVIFQHFVAKFREEYKIDVLSNVKACLRLRAACVRAKKVLSAYAEAPIYIDSLMDEKDVMGLIKREEFEQISAPILECVKRTLVKALDEAGLTVDNVHTVEVVGSGSRVPAIIRILTEFFGKEPRRTMNASECVARGAALECASLSPTFKVLESKVNEWFPASIALSWEVSSGKSQAAENQQSMIVFPKGDPIPSVKAPTFNLSSGRPSSFSLNLLYANASELQAPAKISTYTIGPFQLTKKGQLMVTARLNLHGIVSIESAILNVDGQITNIPVAELVYGGMTPLDLQIAVEKELTMAQRDRVMDQRDRVMEDTKDKKNAVESYVYDMRNKLNDKYGDFIIESEKEQLMATLGEVDDWLYPTKGAYLVKLEELKKQGDPIEERYKEFTERKTLIDQLVYSINSYRDATFSNDTKFDHIGMIEKRMVLNQCSEAERWLREKKQQQDALPKYANPVLLSADIKKKAEEVDRVCRPIMTKPKTDKPKQDKPKPAKPAAPNIQSAVPSRFPKIGLILFSYEELRDSTDGFSRTNFLGEGGFAKVYKGSLSNGRKVAVKVLINETSEAEEEFRNEVDIISRARHRNIVSLVGYCITQTKRLIAYEFVENRSLQDHLNGGKVMDWAVRIKIARGCAKGFAYLHEECPQKIVHRDVKPANILLDFNFVPKVADFGVSKLCPNHSDPLFATFIIGSQGFIDPVYLETQEYSTKTDVYSFGVVLLMLISGQINLKTVHELKKALPTTLRSGEFHGIADERLNKNYDVDEMTRMVTCAHVCLRRDPKDRPDMSQVSRVLENIISATDLRIKTRQRRSSSTAPY